MTKWNIKSLYYRENVTKRNVIEAKYAVDTEADCEDPRGAGVWQGWEQ